LKSLKIYQKLFGENHSDVATSMNNLGANNHSYVATAMNHLGALYRNMGNLSKAEEFHLKSLKIRLNLFGENHSCGNINE